MRLTEVESPGDNTGCVTVVGSISFLIVDRQQVIGSVRAPHVYLQGRYNDISKPPHVLNRLNSPSVTEGSSFVKKEGRTSNTVYRESLSSLSTSAEGVLKTFK